jgi:hypothetical protein
MDLKGRMMWILDSHRSDEKCFIVRADEKLSAFVGREKAIHQFAASLLS